MLVTEIHIEYKNNRAGEISGPLLTIINNPKWKKKNNTSGAPTNGLPTHSTVLLVAETTVFIVTARKCQSAKTGVRPIHGRMR